MLTCTTTVLPELIIIKEVVIPVLRQLDHNNHQLITLDKLDLKDHRQITDHKDLLLDILVLADRKDHHQVSQVNLGLKDLLQAIPVKLDHKDHLQATQVKQVHKDPLQDIHLHLAHKDLLQATLVKPALKVQLAAIQDKVVSKVHHLDTQVDHKELQEPTQEDVHPHLIQVPKAHLQLSQDLVHLLSPVSNKVNLHHSQTKITKDIHQVPLAVLLSHQLQAQVDPVVSLLNQTADTQVPSNLTENIFHLKTNQAFGKIH